jgi:phenylpyruvate tautomerase PptA (4-oxalocrotonate tautomerase family)
LLFIIGSERKLMLETRWVVVVVVEVERNNWGAEEQTVGQG